MKLTPGGKLTWYVPSNFKEETASVIILVADSSGQEVYHTFSLSVR